MSARLKELNAEALAGGPRLYGARISAWAALFWVYVLFKAVIVPLAFVFVWSGLSVLDRHSATFVLDNSLRFEAVWAGWLLAVVPSIYLYRALRWRKKTVERLYCRRCQTDLTSWVKEYCPECGLAAPKPWFPSARERTATETHPRVKRRTAVAATAGVAVLTWGVVTFLLWLWLKNGGGMTRLINIGMLAAVVAATVAAITYIRLRWRTEMRYWWACPHCHVIVTDMMQPICPSCRQQMYVPYRKDSRR